MRPRHRLAGIALAILACTPAEPKALTRPTSRRFAAGRFALRRRLAARRYCRGPADAGARRRAHAGRAAAACDANDIRSFWWPTNGSRTQILTFHRVIDEVAGDANLAWVRGTDTLTFTYDKGQTHSRLASRSMTLAVWRRQPDGSWRIGRMMWGARAP